MGSGKYTTLSAVLCMALAGCAGNGNGLDANGNPVGTGGGTGTAPLTADFQSIQDHIFTPICTKCHIGAGAPRGLQLDQEHSYMLLVGVPSSEQPNVLRVEAGDPDSSYIIQKLEGAPSILGGQMPLGGPYLTQDMIDVVRQWISAGAPQAAAAQSLQSLQSLQSAVHAVQRFEVTATSPDDGSIASDAIAQIIVQFNGEIDSTRVDGSMVTLIRSGNHNIGSSGSYVGGGADDGSPSGNGDIGSSGSDMGSVGGVGGPNSDGGGKSIPVTASVPAGNPKTLLIRPASVLTNGTYQLVLHGALANLSSLPLGADHSFTFTVDTLQ